MSSSSSDPAGASASSSPVAAASIPRSSRPVSEKLLNDKWDHFLSSLVVRSGVGLSFGVIASVLLFKRRSWPAWVGLGFGAGRAWEEADAGFRRGGGATIQGGAQGKGEGLRLVRT